MNPTPSHTAKQTCDIIIALDVPAKEEAMHLLDELGKRPHLVKVGLQLFTRYGPTLIEAMANRGCKVFLDLKLHDIPNTVAHAIESLSHWPIELLTIHALGGSEMIQAACEARDRTHPKMKILAVTVLTSMDQARMDEIGLGGDPQSASKRLAKAALDAGVDGIVCSALEVEMMRESFGPEPLLVVPGIRPSGSEMGDQKRVMTPGEAARLGSSHLVIGRPILQAADPVAMYDQIIEEIASSLA